MTTYRHRALFAVWCLLSAGILYADEGMWLFENPPRQQVKERYGFDLTDDWLEHVRLSSIRFANRGSASFVSPQGLILTNHHVGARNLHELSTPENNLLKKGFYAKAFADEIPCKGLEIIVTVNMEDVSEKIGGAAKNEAGDDLPPEEAQKARSAAIAAMEKDAADATGLRCEVVKLYQGGAYHLYYYKVYNDIRLVWAPEEAIASFGGDPDNYEYPRYCLDCMFFRAYEDGKPAKTEHFLRWGTGGVKDGELTFVSGFPGTTNRAYTREHLEFMRDIYFPYRLQKLFRREVVYAAYGNRSLENQRRIAGDLGAVQNYRKRAMGQLSGLQTPSLWKDLPFVNTNDSASPEKRIFDACAAARDGLYVAYDLTEIGEAFNCRTFQIARMLVRLAFESEKPDAERMKDYREASLEPLRKSLFSETPIYEDVEVLKLTDSLTMFRELYNDDESWERIGYYLDIGKSPKELAVDLIRGSKIRDVAERKRLADGGVRAIKLSNDPMIKLARNMDAAAEHVRKSYEAEVDAVMTASYAELAKRRFERHGRDVYPDATFTLRLSYGAVRGYKEDDGDDVPPWTVVRGMFERAAALEYKEPFDPPPGWKDAESKLGMNTAFNLVTTNDIIGGNSGSPLLNAKGEVVGLAFDGNIHSLSNNFVYTETQSRCVSVHADVILEALKKVYRAERLVAELTKK